MATPTTALANVRAVKSWMNKPFTEFNDTATTVYGFECVCSQAAYEANKLTYGTKLSSAVSAKLIEIIYTDSQARWVGDSNFSYHDGGYIRFLRKFARVPVPHDDYSSTVITLAPVYGTTRDRIYAEETTADGEVVQIGVGYSAYFKYLISPSRTSVVRSRLGFQYSTNPALLTIYTEGSFSVIESDGETTVIRSGDQSVYESTKITRWMGDIYEAVTAFAY